MNLSKERAEMLKETGRQAGINRSLKAYVTKPLLFFVDCFRRYCAKRPCAMHC